MKKLLLLTIIAFSAAAFGQIDLTRDVKKILPPVNGGTGTATWVAGKCVRVSDDGLKLEAAPEDCGTGSGPGGTVYYQTLLNATSALTQRASLNFSNGITCVDNSGASRTDCRLTTPITGTPDLGKIPIGQGDGTAAFADPLVQGLYAAASTSEPNPVGVGAWDGAHLRHFSIDTSGRLNVNINGTVPVSGTFWQATQPVSGTFWQTTQPVSIATMPSTPVTGTFWQATQPVSGTVSINAVPAGTNVIGHVIVDTAPTTAVTGPLTDTQLRATAVPVSGTVTATGPLTDTQLRATAVPVSGTVTATGPLTDTQLRASDVPVSVSNTPHVICDSGCTPGGSTADDSAFSFGTTALNPLGAVVDDTSTNTVAENSIATPRMSTNRVLYVDLGKTTANTTAIKVDNSAVTQPVSGTVTANAGTNLNTSLLALESGGNLASIKAKTDNIPAQGQALAAASLPVVLPAAQVTTLTPPAAITNFANETGGNLAASKTDLDTIAATALAQASTTSGQTGTLVQGATTTAAPTYTTAKTNPLSLQTDGSLRVAVTAAPTTAVTIATAPVLVAGSAIIGKVGIDQTTPGTTNGVQVNAALPAGANVIGHVIADSGSTTAVTGNVASTVADGADVTLGAKADAKSTATDTTAVTAMSVLKQISASVQAPPSQAVTNAGTFAVQATATIADGGDSTLGAKADAKSTATDTTAVTIMSVLKEISAMEQAPASQAVTNAGTFAVQASQSTATSLKAEVVGPTADNAVNPTAKVSTLPVVANAAQPSFTEAHIAPISSDLAGNLRVLPGQPAIATGTITASNSTVTVNTLGYGVATVTVHGTYAGVNFAFKFSDDGGVTYYDTTCSRTDSSVQETSSGVLTSNTTRAWDCSVYAATQFRVAASAYTSGTATIGITMSGHGIEAAPTVALATGTNTIGAVTGTGTAGSAASGVVTVQGVASMTPILSTLQTQTDTVMVGGVNVKEINAVTPLMGAGNTGTGSLRVTVASDQAVIPIGGTVATNVAITDNPINNGAQAVSSENSAVTTARKVQLVADLVGKLITLPYANPENFVMGTTAAITDTTSTSTIASAGGSLRNYVTQCTVSNSHATVGTFVKILDGSTIIWEVYAAAAGGGATASFPVPLKGTAATAVNCQPVTTGANVICSCSGYKGI